MVILEKKTWMLNCRSRMFSKRKNKDIFSCNHAFLDIFTPFLSSLFFSWAIFILFFPACILISSECLFLFTDFFLDGFRSPFYRRIWLANLYFQVILVFLPICFFNFPLVPFPFQLFTPGTISESKYNTCVLREVEYFLF